MTNLNPLLDIDILRFSITLISKKILNINNIGSIYRGKLGFSIKQISCQYEHFQNEDCSDCTLTYNCHYISLFSPISKLHNINNEKVKKIPSPVRPFVFSFFTNNRDGIINVDEPFKIIFSVFGPSIQNIAIFAAAAVHASENMGLSVRSLDKLYPENTSTNKKKITIKNWVDVCDLNSQKIILHCHTPLSMKKNNHIINTKFSFMDIIKAIIRRLRDLKRYYGNDDNMGQIDKNFYNHSKLIHCSTQKIGYHNKNRYSHSQHKLIPLSGFIGYVSLTGNLQIFVPLIKASEIIHIGRGTSNGNGYVSIITA